MNIKRFSGVAALALAGGLVLASCASNEAPAPDTSGSADASTLSGTFNAAGASAQEAAQAAWIKGFQEANSGVTINYSPIGSGDGRKQFINGSTVFAGSDAALTEEELGGEFATCAADSKAIDLPVYISPIAVIFNVEGVESLNVDAETLASIFKGDITNWSDEAITSLNPDAELPDADITVVHRSDDSGTTENFTDYLSAVAPDVWTEEPSDAFPFSFAGAEGAQGTSGVVDAVTNGVNTIGYADASKAGDLSTAALQVGDDFVAYTAEAAAKVVEASPKEEGREANDLAIALDRNTEEAGAYPLVLVSYLIVCQQYADAANAEFVKAYAGYVASDEGQASAAESAGSAPLSAATAAEVQAAIETIQ